VTIRLIGAGLGRTGTMSQKQAIERLTGERCYHMFEVFTHPEDVPTWAAAVAGEPVDWDALFGDCVATVDWPGCNFWRQLADAYPDAPVLLSTRDSAETWWQSADNTIFNVFRNGPEDPDDPWFRMADPLIRAVIPDPSDEAGSKAGYERHNAEVRAAIEPARLIEWQPGDGWAPIAAALGVAVPDEPFPHTNSTKEFRTRAGWD
jgi:hypothetical protein